MVLNYIIEESNVILVTWSERVTGFPCVEDEKLFESYINQGKPVLFDFSQTRVMSNRWLRFCQRLTIHADSLNKNFFVIGLQEIFLEMLEILAIREDLHLFETIPPCVINITH